MWHTHLPSISPMPITTPKTEKKKKKKEKKEKRSKEKANTTTPYIHSFCLFVFVLLACIVTSPFLRCVETAAIIGKEFNINEFIIDTRISENIKSIRQCIFKSYELWKQKIANYQSTQTQIGSSTSSLKENINIDNNIITNNNNNNNNNNNSNLTNEEIAKLLGIPQKFPFRTDEHCYGETTLLSKQEITDIIKNIYNDEKKDIPDDEPKTPNAKENKEKFNYSNNKNENEMHDPNSPSTDERKQDGDYVIGLPDLKKDRMDKMDKIDKIKISWDKNEWPLKNGDGAIKCCNEYARRCYQTGQQIIMCTHAGVVTDVISHRNRHMLVKPRECAWFALVKHKMPLCRYVRYHDSKKNDDNHQFKEPKMSILYEPNEPDE